MNLFLSRRIPHFKRVLLVESGSRALFESLLPGLYELYPKMSVDLVTCFAGVPAGFRSGDVFRVGDYVSPESRSKLVAELRANRYDIIGIICSGEPIMTKWKWMLTARVPAKLFVLNENGDYFWADYSNWRTIAHFFSYRAGLSGSGAITTPARLLLFPFTLAYLLLFAAAVHLRRKVRT